MNFCSYFLIFFSTIFSDVESWRILVEVFVIWITQVELYCNKTVKPTLKSSKLISIWRSSSKNLFHSYKVTRKLQYLIRENTVSHKRARESQPLSRENFKWKQKYFMRKQHAIDRERKFTAVNLMHRMMQEILLWWQDFLRSWLIVGSNFYVILWKLSLILNKNCSSLWTCS